MIENLRERAGRNADERSILTRVIAREALSEIRTRRLTSFLQLTPKFRIATEPWSVDDLANAASQLI
jgi:hypothetical protein